MAADSNRYPQESKRDRLAVQRTMLANERTMLAYSRTAIMLAASGATLMKFYGNQPLAMITGWLLIVAGIGVAVWGTKRFRMLSKTLK